MLCCKLMYRKHFRIRSCQTFLGLVTDPSRCLWILNRILWRGRIRSQNQIRNPATHVLETTSIWSIWVLSTHHHECMYVLTQESKRTRKPKPLMPNLYAVSLRPPPCRPRTSTCLNCTSQVWIRWWFAVVLKEEFHSISFLYFVIDGKNGYWPKQTFLRTSHVLIFQRVHYWWSFDNRIILLPSSNSFRVVVPSKPAARSNLCRADSQERGKPRRRNLPCQVEKWRRAAPGSKLKYLGY